MSDLNKPRFYAHTLADANGVPCSPDKWQPQPMSAHEENVANRAATFSAAFGGTEWARLLGRWHDLGKYSAEFQRYLRSANDADSDSDDEDPPVPAPVLQNQRTAQLDCSSITTRRTY